MTYKVQGYDDGVTIGLGEIKFISNDVSDSSEVVKFHII